MAAIAHQLVADGKGILAADESDGTIKKRFDSINVESTEINRRDYREMLFRTDGIGEYISGVILFDETIRQKGSDGKPFVEVLSEQGIIPGIKVDKGGQAIPGSPKETITGGIDGLVDRLNEYFVLGARFTKWRSVITIDSELPTPLCINGNAHGLGRFAALSQEAGLVPIVEPEVLMDGDHSIDRCLEITETTLREVFYQLAEYGVALEGCLLKPNMVLSGKSASTRAAAQEVAEKTLVCLKRVVPAAVPGLVFLSGGQTDDEATMNLNAINKLAVAFGAPWQLSFSYGRGLQQAPLKVWAGLSENQHLAKQAFYHRAKLTSAARQGKYTVAMEKALTYA